MNLNNQKAVRNHGIYSINSILENVKNLPIESIKIDDLLPALSNLLWDEEPIESNPFSPNDIIYGTIKNEAHSKRIENADTKYPLLIFNQQTIPDEFKNRISKWGDIIIYGKFDVLDGLHRLAKMKIADFKYVNVIIVPWEILQKSRIN